ncbi:hypothetical protein [Tepidibacter thalassicus]|uniref:Uncharacterized protein n=1 Tax=Tepidibacter thalassicus DSM 15285 TaxID=1123350 RepID=A0A1M5S657_9FIRM|nr:hypothetical protein [Tepidibacter thalassicus]SHH33969.1 hypothetical protein SAMN02744040_01647 [Tepidibacter thalassicus DSM 15285]
MDIVYVKYTRERIPQFQIKTIMYRENGKYFVKKEALYEEGKAHIRNIYDNYIKLTQNYKNVYISKAELKNDEIIFDYEYGNTIDKILLNLILKKDKRGFLEKLNWYKNFVENLEGKNYINFKFTNEFLNIFRGCDKLRGLKCLRISNVDLSFDNLIVDGENLVKIIDYEWVFDFPIPIDFLVYRSVINFYFRHIKYTEKFVDIDFIFDSLGITGEYIKIYELMLNRFHSYVFVKDNVDNYVFYSKYLKKSYLINQSINRAYNMQVFADDGSGFCEEKSIVKEMDLDKNSSVKFEFDISSFKSIKSLRVDPINTNCVVYINKIVLVDENLVDVETDEFVTNAEYIFEGKYVFLNDDPQIIIENLDLKRYVKIVIDIDFLDFDYKVKQYMMNLYDSLKNSLKDNKELKQKRMEIEQLKRQLEEKNREIYKKNIYIKSIENELNLLYNSLSWKITEPFRKLKSKLKI